MAVISHQYLVLVNPWKVAQPGVLAKRIRPSHLARRLWRSSRSASCPPFVLVAKAVNRS